MSLGLTLLLVMQQATSPVSPTTPPSADTVGYWQQRADYRIAARLDEARSVVAASGTLTYVNNSPDTLREIYLHQHLNAFRPGSRWSEVDAREGRVRFQNLADPDYGYERFTSTPTVNGQPVTPDYPTSPDSTVVRLALPRPLLPGDSAQLTFEWEARPSIPPRRQGRRGRSFDFAQWYPRVAVYDRAGWRYNPLVPAGEFYGEFGNFDVTLHLAEDQVVGASGVPVEGDPGWERVRAAGRVHPTSGVYGPIPLLDEAPSEPGLKHVRFIARRVHHFAFSVSPDYIYEGGVYVRPLAMRAPESSEAARAEQRPGLATQPGFPIHDTVAVHILYRPGDEAQWGNGQAFGRTIVALRWLEHVFGPYAWPQLTNLHRIEGGGTEFPMMMMNGSASQGLIIHEGAHQYAHGFLANNEWQSAWLDEGLASYVTSWSTGNTLHDLVNHPPEGPRPRLDGYRGRAHLPVGQEATQIAQYRLDLLGRAEPMGQSANEFNEFPVYSQMVYTRAERMYGALRDVMGDSAFHHFLRECYHRWAFKHVDETAMRTSAERVHGEDLRWFFDQWVHRTGLIDYAVEGSNSRREGDGWVTRVRVAKRGEFWHPVPVGARTSSGWTIARAEPHAEHQTVEIRTAERPSAVMIDPHGTTEDWNGRNDRVGGRLVPGRDDRAMRRFGWPFLQQYDRDRTVATWMPLAWYSAPGGLTIGARQGSNYQGWISRRQLDLALPLRRPGGESSDLDVQRIQVLARVENPQPFGARRPWAGVTALAGSLDGVALVHAGKVWNQDRYQFATGPRRSTALSLLGARVHSTDFADPERWEDRDLVEAGVAHTVGRGSFSGRFYAGAGYASAAPDESGGAGSSTGAQAGAYPRMELELKALRPWAEGRSESRVRLFGGYTDRAPLQRVFRESSRDPVETFDNHLVRPRDGVLSHRDAHYRQIGGFGLRGSDAAVVAPRGVSLNLDQTIRVASRRLAPGTQSVWISVFADAFAPLADGESLFLADAGLSLALRGQLYDRPLSLRFDMPFYVNRPELAVGSFGESGSGELEKSRLRWAFSFGELW